MPCCAASRNPKGDYEPPRAGSTPRPSYGLADSQYNLAVLYENGMGVGKDMQQAYKWLLLAAKSGDKDAAAPPRGAEAEDAPPPISQRPRRRPPSTGIAKPT